MHMLLCSGFLKHRCSILSGLGIVEEFFENEVKFVVELSGLGISVRSLHSVQWWRIRVQMGKKCAEMLFITEGSFEYLS